MSENEYDTRAIFKEQVAIVTGAVEGIGHEIARQPASLGAAVYSSYLCQQVRLTGSVKTNNKLTIQPI